MHSLSQAYRCLLLGTALHLFYTSSAEVNTIYHRYCMSSNYEGFKAHPQYGANVHITRSASNVLLMTRKYAKSIVIIHETIAIVCGD